jgi:integrase
MGRFFIMATQEFAPRIVHFTYLTGMRSGEIFNLTWDRISLKDKVIRLQAEDTKTSAG